MSLDVETIGLIIVLLTQIVIIAITFQSLRERVKVLEDKTNNLLSFNSTIHKIESKIDLLYDLYVERHKQK